MGGKTSFSQDVKRELIERLGAPTTASLPDDDDVSSDVSREATYAYLLTTHATFRGGTMRIQSAHHALMNQLVAWLKPRFSDVGVDTQGTRTIVTLTDRSYSELTDWLSEAYAFDATRGRIDQDVHTLSEPERRAFMRALMLTQGSMANPRQQYQLELVVRRRGLVAMAEAILDVAHLDYQAVTKQMHRYIFLKNGDDIAHFLAWIGAQRAVLAYENIRAERELRAQVNRQVNFDSANSTRVARSAAKHHAAIAAIRTAGAFEELPDDLAQVARAREANPYDTLEELGQMLSPPVGKSGVRHRLNRLLTFAEHLNDT